MDHLLRKCFSLSTQWEHPHDLSSPIACIAVTLKVVISAIVDWISKKCWRIALFATAPRRWPVASEFTVASQFVWWQSFWKNSCALVLVGTSRVIMTYKLLNIQQWIYWVLVILWVLALSSIVSIVPIVQSIASIQSFPSFPSIKFITSISSFPSIQSFPSIPSIWSYSSILSSLHHLLHRFTIDPIDHIDPIVPINLIVPINPIDSNRSNRSCQSDLSNSCIDCIVGWIILMINFVIVASFASLIASF